MTVDVALLKTWVGRQEQYHDTVTPVPFRALSATLDLVAPDPIDGATLPPLWHWLYFLPVAQQSQIGADGHPQRGGFLPPVSLPRRMWAGGRLMFHGDLHVGEAIRRQSTVVDVTVKEGRSGTLVFVLVRHEIFGPQGLTVTEEHDIVFRELPSPGEAPTLGRPAASDAVWSRSVNPDPVLLFRYSALTFNCHRIHYDRSYVTQEEGYPGLIVHGPLIATLLADLVRRNSAQRMSAFRFRAQRPLFDIAPFSIHARTVDALGKIHLWAKDPAGFVAMEAEADLQPS